MASEMIHPTALVDGRARIGRAVRIGPFSIVGPEVSLAEAVEVGSHVILESRVEVGAGVKVGHGTAIGGPPQDLKYKEGTPTGVRIGSRTVIREYVTIHRATTPDGWTEIGSDCLIMATSHIAHDCRVGDGVIVINFAGLTGHCEIGAQATIGGYAGLAPFTRVGAFAYIGGCSKITRDVPPFMLVEGNPAVARGVNVIGLRRAGMGPQDRRTLQAAYRLLYRSGLAPGRALERVQNELPRTPALDQLIAFIASAHRGICGAPRASEVGVAGTASPESEVV